MKPVNMDIAGIEFRRLQRDGIIDKPNVFNRYRLALTNTLRKFPDLTKDELETLSAVTRMFEVYQSAKQMNRKSDLYRQLNVSAIRFSDN